MTGQFYYDVRSPQVRSVLFVIEALDIDIERVPIDLFKGEHKSPEFLKVIKKIHSASFTPINI